MKLRELHRRTAACRACPQPCEPYRTGTLRVLDAATTCPLDRWSYGLGDAVAAVAEPIAAASDAVLKTKLKGCIPCGQRKEALNAATRAVKRALGLAPAVKQPLPESEIPPHAG